MSRLVLPFARESLADRADRENPAGWPRRTARAVRAIYGGEGDYPAPWVTGIFARMGSFSSMQNSRAWRCHRERLCAVCGEYIEGPVYLGAYRDPADRKTSGPGCDVRCMWLALQTCPHFRAESEPGDGDVVAFRHDGPGLGYTDLVDLMGADEPYMTAGDVSAQAVPVTFAQVRADAAVAAFARRG